jgi:flagellum-specific peptidoglycan hydrolase FlgJ
MKLIRYLIIIVTSFLFAQAAKAQAPVRKTVKQYINEYKEDAVREMHEDGIPASITLAQGVLESNSGNSPLAISANNHFGIKCQKEWDGPTFIQDDDAKDECFRKYETVFDSYADHSKFLKSRPRYAFLFQLDIADYKGWALGLKAAGYATDPTYATRLIKIIEDNALYNLDTIKPLSPELIASIDNYFNAAEIKSQKKHTEQTDKYELPYSKRDVQLINDRKFIYTKIGETVDEISTEYDVDPRLIYRYNDLDRDKKTRFRPGQIIFLQPKKNKAQEEFHTLARGESMYTVSQRYGIKLRMLYKKNHLTPGTEPAVGTKLWLKKTKKA